MGRSTTNILVCGVGGQGIILASAIMADVFFKAGFDVKQGEVHGMAQRGGSVFSHIRFGPKVYSPVIPMGEVDYLFATEKLEALRWVEWCNPKTVVIADKVQINPPAVNRGEAEYPADVEDFLQRSFERTYLIPATEKAKELGNPRVANIILIGALSNFLDIEEGLWKEVIEEHVPERFRDLNLKAFEEGRRVGGKDIGTTF